MKELVFYAVIAISALFILGYSVHMLVGGLVSPSLERGLIAAACLLGALLIALMAWDVVRRRRGNPPPAG
jgi:hypothetical protein